MALVRAALASPFVAATVALAVLAAPAPALADVRLVVVGDVMLDRDPGRALAAGKDPFEQVAADIRAARAKADVVIPFMHWGEEYLLEPIARQRALAHAMIDAGAEVVLGNHPHVTEGTEIYKGKLIVYSLGNFVFDEWKD